MNCEVTKKGRRSLILVSKVLQAIANRVYFGGTGEGVYGGVFLGGGVLRFLNLSFVLIPQEKRPIWRLSTTLSWTSSR